MIRLIYCYDHRKNGHVYALEIIDAKWFEQYFRFYPTHRTKAELSNTSEHNRLTCSILTLETISLNIQQSLVKEHPQEGDDKLFPLGNHVLCTYVFGNLGCARGGINHLHILRHTPWLAMAVHWLFPFIFVQVHEF
jgi:hypothetical protein